MAGGDSEQNVIMRPPMQYRIAIAIVWASLFGLEIIVSDGKFPSKEKILVKSSAQRNFVSRDGKWLIGQVLNVFYHAT